MKDVLVNVVGTQEYGDQSDAVELTTRGKFYEDPVHYFIEYEEAQEDGTASVHVCVKVKKDLSAVQTNRTGAGTSELLIESGRRNCCQYATEYGDMLIGIHGKRVDAAVEENGGTFEFLYAIDMNGSEVSSNKVLITFKEN